MSEVENGWVAGTTYEKFMGRWSRRLAPKFVSWLEIPGKMHWLDVGCGTGALTDAICICADPASVVGCDPAAAFLDYAKKHSKDKRVSFITAGVGTLPSRAGGFDSVTSLLALNFFPDPEAAVREMRSVTARDGTISACVWDYAGRMEFLRYFWDVVVAVDSSAREFDEGVRFPICRPKALMETFRRVELADVACEAIEIATEFASFDDYWMPLLEGTGPAAAYVASLDDVRREALARGLQRRLPRGRDGSIVLAARAWAVRGIAAE